jgi:excisionase family DNA binding protein
VNTNDLTVAELRLLGYFVRVARQVIPKNHPAADHTAAMLKRLDARLGVARERNPETPRNGNLNHGRTISTREAAELLGISQRRVQQRIRAGEIPARRVGRTYIIETEAITE